MKVGVIGLGKLGLPLVAHNAMSGHYVYGYDVNTDLISLLKSGKFTSIEPNLQENLLKYNNSIEFTSDISNVFLNCDLLSIIVPTPSISGVFSSKIIEEILFQISDLLIGSTDFKLINIVSTVMPGTSVDKFIPILEKQSGKKLGIDFGFCYSPEFIALGSVIENLINPDMILIGADDQLSIDTMKNYCETLKSNLSIPICELTLTEAEIVKISVNNFITTKISFANMIKIVSDYFQGTSPERILAAIGMDKRIGQRYLKPGTPFGGPCFPRDTVALSSILDGMIVNDLPRVTHLFNEEYSRYILNQILEKIQGKKRVGIIGVSYKQDTDVVEESFGVFLMEQLLKLGIVVSYWDSKIYQPIKTKSLRSACYFNNIADLVKSSEVIILPRKLNSLEINLLNSKNTDLPIIDLWN